MDWVSRQYREGRSAPTVTGILPAFRQCVEMSQEAHAVWISDLMRHRSLKCNTKTAFPGRSTQHPQRGGTSSYEADSRLTANSYFFCIAFYF